MKRTALRPPSPPISFSSHSHNGIENSRRSYGGYRSPSHNNRTPHIRKLIPTVRSASDRYTFAGEETGRCFSRRVRVMNGSGEGHDLSSCCCAVCVFHGKETWLSFAKSVYGMPEKSRRLTIRLPMITDSLASSWVLSVRARPCTRTWCRNTKLATSCSPRTSTYVLFPSPTSYTFFFDKDGPQNLQTTVQRIESYVRVLEDKVEQATKKK